MVAHAQDDEYGLKGGAAVAAAATVAGIEVVASASFSASGDRSTLPRAIAALAASGARYIVGWASAAAAEAALLPAAARAGLVGARFVWLLPSRPDLASAAAAGGVEPGAFDGGVLTSGAAPGRGDASGALRGRFYAHWAALEPASVPLPGGAPPGEYLEYLVDAVLLAAAAGADAAARGWAPAAPAPGAVGAICGAARGNTTLPLDALRGAVARGLTGVLSIPSCERPGATALLSVWGPAVGGAPGARAYRSVGHATAAASGATGAVLLDPPVPTTGAAMPPDREPLRGRLLRVVVTKSEPFVFTPPGGAKPYGCAPARAAALILC